MPQRGMRVVEIVTLALAVGASGALACDRPLTPDDGGGPSRPRRAADRDRPAHRERLVRRDLRARRRGADGQLGWPPPATFTFNGGYWTVDAGLPGRRGRAKRTGGFAGSTSYDAQGVPASYRYEEQGQVL